jgi:hypothetical protein
MAAQRLMRRFARWHIWLGWLVGVPILMWTMTGLWMVARPVEEVRGTHLRTEHAAIDPATIRFPTNVGERIHDARLVMQPDGPTWLITGVDGSRWRYSAKFGTVTPPVVEEEAARIARAAYAGPARFACVTYMAAGEAPTEAGTPGAAWQARFSDGTHMYVDDATGEVLALRTGQWRLYDLMWGLHIMDLKTREDTHHPILILFAALAMVGSLLGCVLLFRRRKARVQP